MALSDIFRAVGGGQRKPTTVEIFRRARRYRDEGRFEEAGELVARGLELDPASLVGHLLAGSLHAALREMDRARAAFERVLALDPLHPRALLGLARIALEAGDTARATDLLRRAITCYPDFPEAQALLEVVSSPEPHRPPAPEPAAGVRMDRLRVPPESRELLLLRPDATLLLAHPRGGRTEELAARTAQVCRLATAMLARSGLGPLRHAVIEGAAETTLVRNDDAAILSLTFGRDLETATGLVHLERVWVNSRQELARQA